MKATEKSGKQSEIASCSSSEKKRRGSAGTRESMNQDVGVGERKSVTISRDSVLMDRSVSREATMREVTMMDTGDIDILVGAEVASGAEADRGSTDEGDPLGESFRLSYELHDLMFPDDTVSRA